MIKFEEYCGDVLEAEADMICHQTNCLGIMGAGLASQIKQKYPKVYEKYKLKCGIYLTESMYEPSIPPLLGQAQLVEIDNDKYIANLFGQMGIGEGEVLTDYNALKNAFYDALKQLYFNLDKPAEIVVAIPCFIGCGIAGGDWNIVFKFIKETAKIFADDYSVSVILKIVQFVENT